MTCTSDRWSCPGCTTTVVRQSGQATASWAETVRLVQTVHGRKHRTRTPRRRRTRTPKEDR